MVFIKKKQLFYWLDFMLFETNEKIYWSRLQRARMQPHTLHSLRNDFALINQLAFTCFQRPPSDRFRLV